MYLLYVQQQKQALHLSCLLTSLRLHSKCLLSLFVAAEARRRLSLLLLLLLLLLLFLMLQQQQQLLLLQKALLCLQKQQLVLSVEGSAG